MLNPSVGDILEISSPTNRLRMVVFPALSRPLTILDQSRSHDDMERRKQGGVRYEVVEVNVQEKNPHFL